MKHIFSIITLPLSLVVGAVFILFKRGRSRFFERYGVWNLELNDCLWFHGASLGEMSGLIPVIVASKKKFNCPVLVTATSTSGLERVRAVADEVRLLPFDCSVWFQKVLKKVKPKVLIVTETELWPVFLNEISARAIPMLLINARISEYSFPWYRRFRFFTAPMLKKFSQILAGNEESAERFIALGMDPQAIKVTGNSKYDLERTETSPERFIYKDGVPVLILASLRPGEERLWLPVLKNVISSKVSLGIIIAPRHQEKFEYFESQCKEHGLPYKLWSQNKEKLEPGTVLLLDAMGVLSTLYASADAVFVGGTLEDYGGHNPLEPAACAACPILGPFHSNVSDIVEMLRAKSAVVEVKNSQDLESIVDRIVIRDPELKKIGARAQEVWQDSRGATAKILAHMEEVLHRASS